MRTWFFVIVSLLGVLWLYLSFHFFKLDDANMMNSKPYDNMFFEAIFFVWLFVFWFYLGRFFSFRNTKNKDQNEVNIEKGIVIKSEKEEETQEDNLKIFEWIWPKVEQLLKLNWIKTIKDLSESGYDELKMILERAWDNFKIINPRSWPYQAELAVKKEWGKLKEYQDFLVWGIDKGEFNK